MFVLRESNIFISQCNQNYHTLMTIYILLFILIWLFCTDNSFLYHLLFLPYKTSFRKCFGVSLTLDETGHFIKFNRQQQECTHFSSITSTFAHGLYLNLPHGRHMEVCTFLLHPDLIASPSKLSLPEKDPRPNSYQHSWLLN